MKLDNKREIINFRNGCIQDLKKTLKNYYNIEIEECYLEDFVNEIGDLCHYIFCCNQALHYKKEELEIKTEEDFIALYEEDR